MIKKAVIQDDTQCFSFQDQNGKLPDSNINIDQEFGRFMRYF